MSKNKDEKYTLEDVLEMMERQRFSNFYEDEFVRYLEGSNRPVTKGEVLEFLKRELDFMAECRKA